MFREEDSDGGAYSALDPASSNRARFGSHMYNYMRNLYILGTGFFLIFAAWNTVQSLATTIDPSLGNAFLCSLYSTFTLVSILGPRIVDVLGPKKAMVVGAIPYLAGVLSFLLPSDWSETNEYVLKISVGILVGFGAPLLWTGQGVYLSRIASKHAMNEEETSQLPELDVLHYSNRTNEATNAAKAEFNGIFFSFFQANGIVGTFGTGLVLVLTQGDSVKASFTLIFSALGVVCGLGILLFLWFLPDVEPVEDRNFNKRGEHAAVEDEATVSIYATLKLCFSESKMYLMVPIIFYNGFSLGFIFGTVPVLAWEKAMGKKFGSFGTSWFYLVNTVATLVAGRYAKQAKKQRRVMVLATICQLVFFALFVFVPYNSNVACNVEGCYPKSDVGSCFQNTHSKGNAFPTSQCTPIVHRGNKSMAGDCATCVKYNGETAGSCSDVETKSCDGAMCAWTQCDVLTGTGQMPGAPTLLFRFGGVFLFAVGDAVWESQLPAYLQILFAHSDKDLNAAMANLKMWQSLGFAVQFALGIEGMPLYGKPLEVSMIVCAGLLVVGVISMSPVVWGDQD